MNYTASIRRIVATEALYEWQCDLAETDETIGATLDVLHRLKAAHRAAFGSLVRCNGSWA